MHIVMFEGEAAAARRWLKDDADAYARDWTDAEEFGDYLDTLSPAQLRALIQKTWGSWQEWRVAAAESIAEFAAIEAAQWQAEFDQAAGQRLYGRYMRAAQGWVSCGRTGAEAAAALGDRVLENHRDGEPWSQIAARIGVPRHVAVVWAAEARTRNTLRGIRRQLTTTEKEK
ncbi:hypothetical protein [Nocardia higoensis]|uniref:hypothetical protein n=1 Tax=Nocardia higoensis TaxID=228599 RepID=UPI000308E8EC|nr:hypothetical protein [Nocardia higoensis]